MRIDKHYLFPKDTSASILTSGLLGEQYIGLMPGGDSEMLKNGDLASEDGSVESFKLGSRNRGDVKPPHHAEELGRGPKTSCFEEPIYFSLQVVQVRLVCRTDQRICHAFSVIDHPDPQEIIRAVLNPDHAHEDDGSREFFELEPEDLFERFAQEVPVALQVGEGGAASLDEGGAAFLGDLLSGVKAAARRIANFATYYQMKTRAGPVGKGGVAATLIRVRERHPGLPIHLVGHSFGGRLVTAAAATLQPGAAPVTMTLLQAAFSHNALAEKFDGQKNGAFRTIIQDKRISGPIVITHTRNDKAVGIAYPLASRIAFDNAAALGDANDPYGGMGRNGAQHTPELSASESELRQVAPGQKYAFTPGKVYNLNADEIIKDHSDVTSVPVANAVMSALGVR
jgi:hypothetical protein